MDSTANRLVSATTANGDTTNDWNLRILEIAPTAATVALAGAGAGNVDVGVHLVKVTYTTAAGSTQGGTASSGVTVVGKTINGKVAISAIPTGSAFVTGRKVWMTAAGGSTYYLLSNGTIANNTATTLTANDSDATLLASTALSSSNTTGNLIIGYDGPTGNVITGAGGATIPTNATAISGVLYAADAQVTDAYVITLSPAIASYTNGLLVTFKANTANTGAASLNVNGLGAKTIVKAAGGVTTALADNDIRVGQIVEVQYDGTNFQMQSTLGNAATGGVTGTGTVNTLPKITNATGPVIGDSRITDGGAGQFIALGTDASVKAGESLTAGISVIPDITKLGDWGGNGNSTTLTVDDGANSITAQGVLVLSGFGMVPFGAGSGSIGNASKPFPSLYLGTAANNTSQLTGTFTGDRVATLQDITQTLIGRGASVALTAQASSIGSTALPVNAGVAPAGLYRVIIYLTNQAFPVIFTAWKRQRLYSKQLSSSRSLKIAMIS